MTRCVVSMRSSPRITCVMPIARSSTALARKKSGEPSERTMTKSEIVDQSTVTSPRTMSVKLDRPESGVRKRTVRGPTLGGETVSVRRRRDRGRARRSRAGGRQPGGRRASRRAPQVSRSTRTHDRKRSDDRRRRGSRRARCDWRHGASSQSSPSQLERVTDRVDPFLAGPRGVSVLDPHQERAADMAGVEPVEQRGPSASDVQLAARGRREPDAGQWSRSAAFGAGSAAARSGTASASMLAVRPCAIASRTAAR